jgi:hypothetical protein
MGIGPISLFETVKSNQAGDTEHLDFDQFVQVMKTYADECFESKAAAPLLCMTAFKVGRRSRANATVSSIVVLDIDDHITIEQVRATLTDTGLRALLCSTASHREHHHKFRVFVPLIEAVDHSTHILAWHVLNQLIADGKSDRSKIGCESMFFVPGHYPDAPSVFEDIPGDVYSADELVALVGTADDVMALGSPDRPTRQPMRHEGRSYGGSSSTVSFVDDADLDLARTRLITDRALDLYRNPGGSYHHARFQLLMHIAARARYRGISLTDQNLLFLFNQVDREDGSFYQSPDDQRAILKEAQKSLGSM